MLSPASNITRFQAAFARLESIVHNVPRYGSPGELAVAHQQASMKATHRSKNGASTGVFFELIIYDALIQFGVQPDNMRLSVKHPGTNTEADILVRRGGEENVPLCLMVKASLRERWKQEDRDAMAIRNDANNAATYILRTFGMTYNSATPPIVWCLTDKEHPQTTKEAAITHARRIGSMCHAISPNRFITIHDTDAMERLLRECLA